MPFAELFLRPCLVLFTSRLPIMGGCALHGARSGEAACAAPYSLPNWCWCSVVTLKGGVRREGEKKRKESKGDIPCEEYEWDPAGRDRWLNYSLQTVILWSEIFFFMKFFLVNRLWFLCTVYSFADASMYEPRIACAVCFTVIGSALFFLWDEMIKSFGN